jgi:hypothetical protein
MPAVGAGDLHAIIERRDPPRVSAAAAPPGDADPLRVHLGRETR